MDLEALMKDAALFGLAIGVVAMALFLLWAFRQYLVRPTVTVAAGTSVPFGFALPS